MNPQTEELFRLVDTYLFSSNFKFSEEGIEYVKRYLRRWDKRIRYVEDVAMELKEES